MSKNPERYDYHVAVTMERPEKALSTYAPEGWRLVSACPGFFDAMEVWRTIGFTLFLERPTTNVAPNGTRTTTK